MNPPDFQIWDHEWSSIVHDMNVIVFGYECEDTLEYLVTTLCHELHHWAHWYDIRGSELDKYLDAKNRVEILGEVPYHKTLSERMAWWGLNMSGELTEVLALRKVGEKI